MLLIILLYLHDTIGKFTALFLLLLMVLLLLIRLFWLRWLLLVVVVVDNAAVHYIIAKFTAAVLL